MSDHVNILCFVLCVCVCVCCCFQVNTIQAHLNEMQPVILDTLESLVDPKLLSADRSKLQVLLQSSKR